MIYSLLFCSFAAASWAKSVFAEPSSQTQATVTYNADTGSFDVTEGQACDTGDAYGTYYLNYNSSGWNYFDGVVQSEVDSPEDHLMYLKALGFLEGYLTCDTIKVFYPNFYSGSFGTNKPGPKTIAFLQANYDWLKSQAAQYPDDDYWHTVDATLHQLEGLYEGYVAGCPSSTAASDVPDYTTMDDATLMHFLLMNAWGDLYQITAKFFEPGVAQSPHRHIERCSAIVKLLPDFSDVVFGHATWDTFESAGPRILKHYSFPLLRNSFAEHHYDTFFSSSPGLLSSVDDFFIVSGYAQLAIQETTNNLYNVSLLQDIVPNTALSYMRAILANQLATSGAHWASVFDQYHSGTYTNQWMVLDLALFTPGSAPKPGFFTVYEEVPTFSQYEDQTDALLRDGYWGSYNVPFYPQVAEMSGYARLCERSDDYCYTKAPRALLFQQYQESVTDVASGQWMLGYNNFQYDAASKNDSCNAIACRGDLEPNARSRGAYGAIDAKVTSATLSKFNNGYAPLYMARVGPSYDQQVPFCWSNVENEESYSHAGQPDCYTYAWQAFPPQ